MMARADLSDDPADKVLGGEILLRRPWQRALSVAGVAGSVLLLLALDLS
jgi:hypothetical protein